MPFSNRAEIWTSRTPGRASVARHTGFPTYDATRALAGIYDVVARSGWPYSSPLSDLGPRGSGPPIRISANRLGAGNPIGEELHCFFDDAPEVASDERSQGCVLYYDAHSLCLEARVMIEIADHQMLQDSAAGNTQDRRFRYAASKTEHTVFRWHSHNDDAAARHASLPI